MKILPPPMDTLEEKWYICAAVQLNKEVDGTARRQKCSRMGVSTASDEKIWQPCRTLGRQCPRGENLKYPINNNSL